MENISLLLSGEYSRGLPCISFNSDENWDVQNYLSPLLSFFTFCLVSSPTMAATLPVPFCYHMICLCDLAA
jgi:hypothetical protein